LIKQGLNGPSIGIIPGGIDPDLSFLVFRGAIHSKSFGRRTGVHFA
jgi:hypothetical protein